MECPLPSVPPLALPLLCWVVTVATGAVVELEVGFVVAVELEEGDIVVACGISCPFYHIIGCAL